MIIQEGEKLEEEELSQDNSAVTSPAAPMKGWLNNSSDEVMATATVS